ncbi:hypothetical protein MMC21_000437 [Puttea exsequens]|nr:hypothetical protein [Puttea exsequens]
MSVGAGMLTTLSVKSSSAQWIGYQIIYGAGIGLGLQLPLIAAQAVLPMDDIPSGTAIIGFFQSLGGSILLAVSQTIFTSKLISELQIVVPDLNRNSITKAGATAVSKAFTKDVLLKVLPVYNDALTQVFYVAVAVSVISMIGSLLIEWRSVKEAQETTGKGSGLP